VKLVMLGAVAAVWIAGGLAWATAKSYASDASTIGVVACRTTPPSRNPGAWARQYGIRMDSLSGNGDIYAVLPRWPAVRLSDGSLHAKIPWLFSPRSFDHIATVRFNVRAANGRLAGSLTSSSLGSATAGGTVGLGHIGPLPTSLNVPRAGCYRLTAQAGSLAYSAYVRVY
jgi:hypothetical protein